jgi:hypothetical protein
MNALPGKADALMPDFINMNALNSGKADAG